MSQWWRDLCFLHWRVDPDVVAPMLPAGTAPDLHGGSAWVGLIPFRMVDAALGSARPVPFLGTFLETNVRTYSVDGEGRRGVVFLSLDAERLAVVLAARLTLGVPYRWARMRYAAGTGSDGRPAFAFRSRRHLRGRAAPATEIRVAVGRPIAEPTDRDVFLTARFGAHTTAFGRTLWVPNAHAPWPLHEAELISLEDSLVAAAGLGGIVGRRPPDSVLYSPGVRTVFGRPVTVRGTPRAASAGDGGIPPRHGR